MFFFFLGHCNSTFCLSGKASKALSAFLSSPSVACTLGAPLSYLPYATLNYPICCMYPFLFPSQPHPSLPCPTLPCSALLCNMLYHIQPCHALSSATLPYSAECNRTLMPLLKALYVILQCVMCNNNMERIFTSNVCIVVVPSHEGRNFKVHLTFPFTALKKIEVFSYFWLVETSVGTFF